MNIFNIDDLKYAKNDKIIYNNYINLLDTNLIDNFINELIPKKNIKNNFKSLLNKCTENNHQLITKDILLLLEEGTGTKEDLLNTIKDISINQYDFIDKYIKLLENLKNLNFNFNTIVQDYFLFINNYEIIEISNYNSLCEYNNNGVKLIGFTIFLIKLEYNGFINGYIDIIIKKLFDKIKNSINDIIIYYYILSLYELFLIVYPYYKKYNKYIIKLKQIKQNIKSKKNIFKIEDIIDHFSL